MTIKKLWPFWIFILLYELGGTLQFEYLPVLGSHFSTTWFTGIIVGSLSLIQFAFDVPAGILLDRFGYTRLLRIGVIIFILSCLIMAFTPGLMGFILATFIAAFGWLFMMPGVNAYILSVAPREEAEKYISFRDTFNAAGICIGSIFVAIILNFSQFIVGLIAATVLLLALLLIFLTPDDKISVHQEIKIKHHHFYIRRQVFKKIITAMKKMNPTSWLLLLQGFCASVFYGGVWFTVPLMMANSSKNIFGFSLGIFDLAIIIIGFLIGKFFPKLRENTTALLGLLLFSIGGLIVGHQIEWIFILFAFLAGSGDEISNIALWSWLAKLDQDHQSDGEVSSVISFFIDIGYAIGPIMAGILYDLFGGELTITFCALPILITFIISLFFVTKYSHTLNINYLANLNYPHRSRGKK